MILLSIISITIPVLLSVAFFTLAERTVMASMQRRVGPQVSGYFGILQPIFDGLKAQG
jgi:NADH:ubiquinone oxidoreductase subunit H